jgi:multidrug efflux pump subunit AcrA (membrane-fusion protein)
MNVIISVLKDFIGFFSLKTKTGRIRFVLLSIVLIGLTVFLGSKTEEETEEISQMRSVQTAIVSSFSEDSAVQIIGTVAAIDQAIIQSETSGRVVSVSTDLGSPISVGTVIATLENANEYASLLQAQGSYEAAQAAAANSDISLESSENALQAAQNQVVSAVRTAYTTASGVLFNEIDRFYRDPEGISPGLRIGSNGNSDVLRNQRVSLQASIAVWKQQSLALQATDELRSSLSVSKQNVSDVITLLDTFITLTSDNSIRQDTIDGVAVGTYTTGLVGARSSLIGLLTTIENAETSLFSAEEAVNQARIGSTQTDTVSSANAQLKQALGSLKAAEANYAKTILRSPIAGVVNVLDIKTGDYVGASQKVAEIANNDALEITSFVGQSDRSIISLNQRVLLEGDIEGVVSNIAPVVNTATGKIEIKIQSTSPDLVNGETVVISLQSDVSTSTQVTSAVTVPLTAVKFSMDAGVVYTVADGVIVANPVEVGSVRNIFIEIPSGITADMEIVVDARGLSEGEAVTVISN